MSAFRVNQKVGIYINDTCYKSNIEDVDDNGIYIDIPYSSVKKSYEVFIGMKISFEIYSNNEIIRYSGVVTDRKREGFLRLAYISRIQAIESVQRREFFRFPVTVKAYYCSLKDDVEYKRINDVPMQCYENLKRTLTVDLSGGGAKIICEKKYDIGEKLLVRIDIPESVYAIGETIRCEKNGILHNYRLSMKFIVISEGSRNKIIKFIFDKSIEKKNNMLR